MVALNFSTDPTLDAVFEAMEAIEAAQPRRGYLGASSLGHKCERMLWYQFNGHPREAMKRGGIMATEDGHRTEAVVVERLKLVPGIQIYTQDENGEQFGFTKFDGKFQGHYDGVIQGLLQAPKTWHIFEAKACNEKKFAELRKCIENYGEKQALENWDYTFFIQAQCYMGEEKLDRHYLVCATPGGRDMISCRTNFDKSIYEANIGKAQRIINAKSEPERFTSVQSHYLCKWCPYQEICWKENA